MKVVLIAVAAFAGLGALVENKKGGYIALFSVAVIAYIAIGLLGGSL